MVEKFQFKLELKKFLDKPAVTQDGTQFKPKMLDTGFLKRFVPKEWAEANHYELETYKGYVPLLMISKVFEYNCRGEMAYKNSVCLFGQYLGGKILSIGTSPR